MAYYDVIESPIGPIFIGGSAAGLHRIDFTTGEGDAGALADRLARDAGEPVAHDTEAAGEATRQLRAYFRGERMTFDLPLAPRGTAFQQHVWAMLRAIPHGETAPSAPITRWHGTTIASGFRPFAAPTARDAAGRPRRAAMAPYVAVSPWGIARSMAHTCC